MAPERASGGVPITVGADHAPAAPEGAEKKRRERHIKRKGVIGRTG